MCLIDTTNVCHATSCWWTCGQNLKRGRQCRATWLRTYANYDCWWASWIKTLSLAVEFLLQFDHCWCCVSRVDFCQWMQTVTVQCSAVGSICELFILRNCAIVFSSETASLDICSTCVLTVWATGCVTACLTCSCCVAVRVFLFELYQTSADWFHSNVLNSTS